ncbi:hypothetical protein LUTEI9C_140273 [Luteimonas sp. 9C]|nr:hypothetical protein LUTEI9C_140273 [Luteimonas sp. 9C]
MIAPVLPGWRASSGTSSRSSDVAVSDSGSVWLGRPLAGGSRWSATKMLLTAITSSVNRPQPISLLTRVFMGAGRWSSAQASQMRGARAFALRVAAPATAGAQARRQRDGHGSVAHCGGGIRRCPSGRPGRVR